MKYSKPALSIRQQADLLISRGMGGAPALIEKRLSSVNYYRLSGYWYPFKKPGEECFLDGTEFETVWDRYVFDRRLRLLVMDAIERIEIAARTFVAYHHSLTYGPFGYIENRDSLPNLSDYDHSEFLKHVADEAGRSQEHFVGHYRAKYTGSPDLPLWIATEVMSFGTVLRVFQGSIKTVRRQMAENFRAPYPIVESWLLSLNTIRNICAHHCRLWNRVLRMKPQMPPERIYPDWYRPVLVGNDKIFCILTICRHCLTCIAPQSKWGQRVDRLLTDADAIPIQDMGFPDDWRKCPIWRKGL